jgi:hypothetical protein
LRSRSSAAISIDHRSSVTGRLHLSEIVGTECLVR